MNRFDRNWFKKRKLVLNLDNIFFYKMFNHYPAETENH